MKIYKHQAYTAYINYSTLHLGANITMVEKSAYKSMPEYKKQQIPETVLDELATLALAGSKDLRKKYYHAIKTYKFFVINRYGIYSSAQPQPKLLLVYVLLLDPNCQLAREGLIKLLGQ
jgi:hypothetical protein